MAVGMDSVFEAGNDFGLDSGKGVLSEARTTTMSCRRRDDDSLTAAAASCLAPQ